MAKRMSVKTTVSERKWMRGLQRMLTVAKCRQFIQLWSQVRLTQLIE
jgi:hypothetical protein